MFGCSSKSSKKILIIHQAVDSGEVDMFRLLKTNSDEHNHQQFRLFCRYFIQKYAIIRENFHMNVGEMLLEELFHDEWHLAWIVPLKLFFVRINLVSGDSKLLDGERLIWAIPEERKQHFKWYVLVLMDEVGDCHLTYSQHAAPATVWIIVGGRHDLDDTGSIGHENILLFFFLFHLGGPYQIY